jgi:Flp pilus assembly pilin Flp
MTKFLSQLWNDESGISSVEYALLLAFVAAGIIFGAEALSNAVEGEMFEAASCISASVASATTC